MSRTDVLYLFDRPSEPICVPKGDKKTSFTVPASYLPEQYQNVAEKILNRFGEQATSSIAIKKIAIPDLSRVMEISRREPFSLFVPKHQKCATHLIELFLGMRTYDDFLSLAVYCRDRVNTQMFIYALSVAILHRSDTKNLALPNVIEILPGQFLNSSAFNKAREEANVVPAGSRRPIEIPLNFTATDHDMEHRVAYFREDLGINLHHWHWHLVYPYRGPDVVVNKDRRGELFYYMHHQVMARYNTERLCNKLARVKRLNNLRDKIDEGYFPKLNSLIASRVWPSRPSGTLLQDVNRKIDQVKIDISDVQRSWDRIMESIHSKTIRGRNGEIMALPENGGIDILGNMVEASNLSPNSAYYGNLHNDGHDLISFCHDPEHRYLENFAVMGDSTTSMRDPIFYRWHAFIDDIFTSYKTSLPPYTAEQLSFPGISVAEISVRSAGKKENELTTHWTKNDVELSRGLDFAPRGSILARITHLNHSDFTYTIRVNNANGRATNATVRIFIAPTLDEANQPLPIAEQMLLMIEMDKFTRTLVPGSNTILRESTESALTIPFEMTFRDLNENRPIDEVGVSQFSFCGCGWPQHMLVPRGTNPGFPMELFVMITDFEADKVTQAQPEGCENGVIFCGLRNRKYPDARPMGFPFDRIPRPSATTMDRFLTPNMRTSKITIRFNDTIQPNRLNNSAQSSGASIKI